MEADDMSLRVASFSCYLNNPEESFVQRINGGSSEDFPAAADASSFPVRARTSSVNHAGVKSPSLKGNKIPKAAPLDRGKNNQTVVIASDHDTVEFSPYVTTPEKDNKNGGFAFMTASGGPVEDPTASFVFPQKIKNPSGGGGGGGRLHTERRIGSGKARKDGEINIFDADKYFNAELDLAAAGSRKVIKYKNEEIPVVVESPCTKAAPKSSAVSVCSEPSSYGSQAVLLRNSVQAKPRKGSRRSFFRLRLSCQGGCLDKKAVVVDERAYHASVRADHKISGNSSSGREEEDVKTAERRQIKEEEEEEEEEEGRKSLEVFGSQKTSRKQEDVAANLERKLSVLTWDAIPNADQNHNHHLLTAATAAATTTCDDMASDASSDLFEIENISNSTKYGLTTLAATRDDYASGCASPVTPYAPSEASISWSVVTASAADYSSVISDYNYDEKSVSIVGGGGTLIHRTGKFKDLTAGKSSPKSPSAGILGCNSHGIYRNLHTTSPVIGES